MKNKYENSKEVKGNKVTAKRGVI